MIGTMKPETEACLSRIDFEGSNRDFPWTGGTMGSVVLFLMRHGQFHLGEMSAPLNERRNGEAQDHYVRALTDTA